MLGRVLFLVVDVENVAATFIVHIFMLAERFEEIMKQKKNGCFYCNKASFMLSKYNCKVEKFRFRLILFHTDKKIVNDDLTESILVDVWVDLLELFLESEQILFKGVIGADNWPFFSGQS